VRDCVMTLKNRVINIQGTVQSYQSISEGEPICTSLVYYALFCFLYLECNRSTRVLEREKEKREKERKKEKKRKEKKEEGKER
jgi:hypothetical protein